MATALKLRSDIKKLKKAIDTKGISAAIKVKLRNQLEKAENELASMQKGGKPRKVSTTKGTATTLTSLQKLIKRKKYGVYQGKGVDLKKDAGEGAKATGRRVSKGLKANQFGSKGQNKGNVYYEYRPNRIDVKQPSKKAKYPKLEKGGELEEQTVYLQVKPRFYDELKEKADKDNIHLEFIEDNEDGYEVYRAEMTKNQLSDFKKEIPFTYSFDYKYAKGGMTATKANVIFKQYERNEGRNDHSENVVLLAKHFGTKEDLQLAQSIQKKHDSLGHMPPDLMKQRDELSDKLYPMLVAAKKKDKSVMAQGGQTDGKNGYVAFYKGKRIEVYADTKYEAQLKAAKIFNAKKSYDVNVALAEVDGEQHYNSTMMAKGGRINKDFNGKSTKEKWGQHDLSKMYENNLDLIADVVDYIRSLQKDVGQSFAKDFVYDMMAVLKEGKITYNDGSSLTFEKGGKINDQYEGKSAGEIWDAMSKAQRQHFIYDHAEQIGDYRGKEKGELSSKEIIAAYNSDFDKLDKDIKNRFENHVREGQYEDGGMTADKKLEDGGVISKTHKIG